MKVLVAYDGTLQAKDALKYGVEKVRKNGGEVVALHVFNSNMFLDYDVFGAEERARLESMKLAAEARRILAEIGDGVKSRVIVTEGDPEEETMNFAREYNVDLLLCSPAYKSITRSFKMLPGDSGAEVSEDAITAGTKEPGVYVVAQR
jgi:nucleotide-binding universal stress UspA family protein